MKKALFYSFFIATVVFYGCHGNPDAVQAAKRENEQKKDSLRGEGSEAAMPIATDMDFMVNTSSMIQLDLQLTALAGSKSRNQALRRFAAELTTGHRAMNGQLQSLAGSSQVTLPDGLSDKQKREKERLEKMSGAAFDKQYTEEMIDHHKALIEEFETHAKHGSESTIKTFAENFLPKLKLQLETAKNLSGNLPAVKDTMHVPGSAKTRLPNEP